jgi:hypothetical protein
MILASWHDRVGANDPARLQLAEQLVAEGREDTILPQPDGVPAFRSIESAAGLVHRERAFGPFASAGHTPWIASIRVPVLATLGTIDHNPDLYGAQEDMRKSATQAPPLRHPRGRGRRPLLYRP